MYEHFHKLRERAFRLDGDPRFYFPTATHREGLALLKYGIRSSTPVIVLLGDAGTGKSLLVRRLAARPPADMRLGMVYAMEPGDAASLGFDKLLQQIAEAFGLSAPSSGTPGLMTSLYEFVSSEYKSGRGVLLIVDGAERCTVECLWALNELVRVLRGAFPVFQSILVGRTALLAALEQIPGNDTFRSQGLAFHLKPLGWNDTRAYIGHRLRKAGADGRKLFADAALRAIYTYSRGLPALINVLCETALLHAASDVAPLIDEYLIHEIVKERASSGLYPFLPAFAQASGSPDHGDVPAERERALAPSTIRHEAPVPAGTQAATPVAPRLWTWPRGETARTLLAGCGLLGSAALMLALILPSGGVDPFVSWWRESIEPAAAPSILALPKTPPQGDAGQTDNLHRDLPAAPGRAGSLADAEPVTAEGGESAPVRIAALEPAPYPLAAELPAVPEPVIPPYGTLPAVAPNAAEPAVASPATAAVKASRRRKAAAASGKLNRRSPPQAARPDRNRAREEDTAPPPAADLQAPVKATPPPLAEAPPPPVAPRAALPVAVPVARDSDAAEPARRRVLRPFGRF